MMRNLWDWNSRSLTLVVRYRRISLAPDPEVPIADLVVGGQGCCRYPGGQVLEAVKHPHNFPG
jgi:hypothetical protein